MGRGVECAIFKAALTTSGSPFAVLYLHGPGGVGKTSVLTEFQQIAAREPQHVPTLRVDARSFEVSPEGFWRGLALGFGIEPVSLEVVLDHLNSCGQRPVPLRSVLMIDTFERCAPYEDWLREHFLPRLGSSVLVMLSGRLGLSLAWRSDPGWADLVRVVQLRNLSPDEGREYLSRRGVPDAQHDSALAFTHSHPLALALVADTFNQRGSRQHGLESSLRSSRIWSRRCSSVFSTRFPARRIVLRSRLAPSCASPPRLRKKYIAFEPVGIILMATEMGKEVVKFYPDYNGTFTLGTNGAGRGGTFLWTGVDWTPGLILGRMTLFASAILLTFFSSLFFDRFDPSASKPRKTKNTASLEPVFSPRALPVFQLTPLNVATNRFSFFTVLLAEFKLLIKGQRWWWYVIAGGILIACLSSPSAILRHILLPMAWVWPLLIWSAIGNREVHNNVQQMTFSSAFPLMRQLPAQWLAGFVFTLLVSLGAILRFTVDGDTVGLMALLSGTIFIPSLALASGVWSGSGKPFEILYITLWYLGPLNNLPSLDYIGSHGNGRPEFFFPFSLALIAFAVYGRARQIRH